MTVLQEIQKMIDDGSSMEKIAKFSRDAFIEGKVTFTEIDTLMNKNRGKRKNEK